MFNNILVAYDESPESGRALLTGIHLAKSLNAKLRAVTVQENLPPYAGYIDAGMPGGTVLLRQQAVDEYRYLHTRPQQAAQREGVILAAASVSPLPHVGQRTGNTAYRLRIAWVFTRRSTRIPSRIFGSGSTPSARKRVLIAEDESPRTKRKNGNGQVAYGGSAAFVQSKGSFAEAKLTEACEWR